MLRAMADIRRDILITGLLEDALFEDCLLYTSRVPNVSLFLEDVKDYRSLLVKNGNTYDYQPQSQMPWFVNLIPSLLILSLIHI